MPLRAAHRPNGIGRGKGGVAVDAARRASTVATPCHVDVAVKVHVNVNVRINVHVHLDSDDLVYVFEELRQLLALVLHDFLNLEAQVAVDDVDVSFEPLSVQLVQDALLQGIVGFSRAPLGVQ